MTASQAPSQEQRPASSPCVPLVFVAMPFGKKPDATRTLQIDFDDIYLRGIKAAMDGLDVECIRADEERGGGIIHVPMFERLLLADVTIVDVTIPNPNVFYELGVRHAARPRSTIIVWANQGSLPFDISMISSIPYQLVDGKLTDENAAALQQTLRDRVAFALANPETSDSPLFQLIPSFPGITLPHEVTESFRDRSRYVDGIRNRLEAARMSGDKEAMRDQIAAIERELGEPTQNNAELYVDTLLSYRDIGAWDAVITLAERLPQWLMETAIPVRQQYALALNRRNQGDDRAKAESLLQAIVKQRGDDPETCGLIGRIYKDRYKETLALGNAFKAAAFLEQAISWYRRGFWADPRDYYPGINLANLLAISNTDEASAELKSVVPAVTFAVARLGGTESRDYWQVATAVQLAVLADDWQRANRGLVQIASIGVPPFGRQTTLDDLVTVREAQTPGVDLAQLDAFIENFKSSTEPSSVN